MICCRCGAESVVILELWVGDKVCADCWTKEVERLQLERKRKETAYREALAAKAARKLPKRKEETECAISTMW